MRAKRLFVLRFIDAPSIWPVLARAGKPIQYAHVPQPLALPDVWTGIAGRPFAFEPPSAGFVLDWGLIAELRKRGVGFATLTHAAGISSTGDRELDALLPFDEPFDIPSSTAEAVARTRDYGGRVIAVGTTVVRALETVGRSGEVQAGRGLASGRIGPDTDLKVVDGLLTGAHAPGESHFELLQAFADETTLSAMVAALEDGEYRTHEFGDVVYLQNLDGSSAATRSDEAAISAFG